MLASHYDIHICLLIILRQNLEKNCSKEQDFNCTFAALAKNRHKNRYQKFLPRMNIKLLHIYSLLVILDIADSARVIIPQLDGNSYYINFCYIDVSVELHPCVFYRFQQRTMIEAKHFWQDLDQCTQQEVIFGQ